MGLTSKDLPVMPRPEGPPPDPVDTSPGGIQIEDIKRLTLRPGDVLVVRLPIDPTGQMVEEIRMKLKRRLPDHEVIVTGPDVELGVVSGWA